MSSPNIFDNLSALSQAQPWSESVEELLHEWADEAEERSKVHDKAASIFKSLRTWTGPAIVIICMVMAPLCNSQANSDVSMWGFLTVGVSQGIIYLCDFSGRAERHLNFATRYADMCTDICETMHKPFRCRPLADVFITKVKTTRMHLNRNAPNLYNVSVFSSTHSA